MKVTLTWQEYCNAAIIGVRRRINSQSKAGREQRDLAQRPTAERFFYNVNGACAEAAAAKALNLYWPASINAKKSEPDVGSDIQVRCGSASHSHLIVRVDDPPNFCYLLVTGVTPDFELRGWIHGSDARRKEWWGDCNNSGKCWWVPQSALLPPEQLRFEPGKPPTLSLVRG